MSKLRITPAIRVAVLGFWTGIVLIGYLVYVWAGSWLGALLTSMAIFVAFAEPIGRFMTREQVSVHARRHWKQQQVRFGAKNVRRRPLEPVARGQGEVSGHRVPLSVLLRREGIAVSLDPLEGKDPFWPILIPWSEIVKLDTPVEGESLNKQATLVLSRTRASQLLIPWRTEFNEKVSSLLRNA